MKVPMRGEIWKADDVDILYYIISLDKFSVNCVTLNYGGTFGVYRIGTLTFLRHHHFIGNSKTDVADLFKEQDIDQVLDNNKIQANTIACNKIQEKNNGLL